MREILFRGKTLTGKWVEGAYYKQKLFYGDKEDADVIITSEENLTFDQAVDFAICDSETIGQYTGLTVNGTKIFEGDIVKDSYGDSYVIKYGRHDLSCCGCCYQSHDSMGFYLCSKQGYALSDEDVWDNLEIIGNIHDNPELLKEGADNG